MRGGLRTHLVLGVAAVCLGCACALSGASVRAAAARHAPRVTLTSSVQQHRSVDEMREVGIYERKFCIATTWFNLPHASIPYEATLRDAEGRTVRVWKDELGPVTDETWFLATCHTRSKGEGFGTWTWSITIGDYTQDLSVVLRELSNDIPKVHPSMTPEQIRAPIQRAAAVTQACGVVDGERVTGTVVTRFVIRPSGFTDNVRVTKNETGRDAVGACLIGVLAGLRFDKPKGGGIVRAVFPFRFQP